MNDKDEIKQIVIEVLRMTGPDEYLNDLLECRDILLSLDEDKHRAAIKWLEKGIKLGVETKSQLFSIARMLNGNEGT